MQAVLSKTQADRIKFDRKLHAFKYHNEVIECYQGHKSPSLQFLLTC